MGAMDTLMAQNYLTATISAMLPGAMALAVMVTALRGLVRRLRSRRRSRASLLKQVCVCSLPLKTPLPHTTNNSGLTRTARSANTQSAGPANTGPRRTATEDKVPSLYVCVCVK